jgi:hypothetical protein
MESSMNGKAHKIERNLLNKPKIEKRKFKINPYWLLLDSSDKQFLEIMNSDKFESIIPISSSFYNKVKDRKMKLENEL